MMMSAVVRRLRMTSYVMLPVGSGAARRQRHAVEVRHASFLTAAFVDLARKYSLAIVITGTVRRARAHRSRLRVKAAGLASAGMAFATPRG